MARRNQRRRDASRALRTEIDEFGEGFADGDEKRLSHVPFTVADQSAFFEPLRNLASRESGDLRPREFQLVSISIRLSLRGLTSTARAIVRILDTSRNDP